MKIHYSQNLKAVSRELRTNGTLAEVLLWNQLKRKKMHGYQFIRQKPINSYVVDFYCSKLKLVIEVDGESHRHKFDEDSKRQRELENMGLHFLRLNDHDVKKDMVNVLRVISNWIQQHGRTTPCTPFC